MIGFDPKFLPEFSGRKPTNEISKPCCVKTGENDRFQHKKCMKTQNFKSSKMNQKSI